VIVKKPRAHGERGPRLSDRRIVAFEKLEPFAPRKFSSERIREQAIRSFRFSRSRGSSHPRGEAHGVHRPLQFSFGHRYALTVPTVKVGVSMLRQSLDTNFSEAPRVLIALW
jgi:hypothetical protein